MRNLLLVITLALLLRFYNLGIVPPSINWDEASNGYNAYSILKTGRDEYGASFPLYNRSFDDYKPPLYMYLNMLTVGIFDLNEFSVRLPSAALGLLLPLLVYFLLLRLFNLKIAILAAFFAAIAPWTVHFSRVGFESNVGLIISLMGFTALVWSLPKEGNVSKKNIVLLIVSAAFVGITFYTYHAARLFTPILGLIFLILFRAELLRFPKFLLFIFLAIPLIIITPFFLTAPSEAIAQRYKVVTLGAQKESTDDYVKFVGQDEDTILSHILHDRKVLLSRIYLSNYLSHFNPEFIYISGDRNLRHHIEGFGLFPLFLLPAFLIGLYSASKGMNKHFLFITLWFISAPIPAIPADAAPHAVRSVFLTVPIFVFTALGIQHVKEIFRYKKMLITFFSLMLLFYFFSYLHNYYFHYSRDKAEFWMYGFKDLVAEINDLQDYPVINVDSSIEQGYVFWLFFNKYDPNQYQQNLHKPNIGNISFNDNKVEEGEVFASLADHFTPDLVLLDTIYYPNGKEAIKIGRKKYSWEK